MVREHSANIPGILCAGWAIKTFHQLVLQSFYIATLYIIYFRCNLVIL